MKKALEYKRVIIEKLIIYATIGAVGYAYAWMVGL